MAKLILTRDEKAAVSMLGQWSDEAIANAVRYCATMLCGGKENIPVFAQTCGQILCALAHSTNSKTLNLKLEGVTSGDLGLGDWQINVMRIERPETTPGTENTEATS